MVFNDSLFLLIFIFLKFWRSAFDSFSYIAGSGYNEVLLRRLDLFIIIDEFTSYFGLKLIFNGLPFPNPLIFSFLLSAFPNSFTPGVDYGLGGKPNRLSILLASLDLSTFTSSFFFSLNSSFLISYISSFFFASPTSLSSL